MSMMKLCPMIFDSVITNKTFNFVLHVHSAIAKLLGNMHS